MEQKSIDLNQSVHSLCKEYPELVEILASIGFEDITKPGMLASAGRFMTLPKGAVLKKLDSIKSNNNWPRTDSRSRNRRYQNESGNQQPGIPQEYNPRPSAQAS